LPLPVKYFCRPEAIQDSQRSTPRLNINVGLRLSQNWATVKAVEGAAYNTFRLAPRVGLTFDIFGDKTKVLKAQYGQFTEATPSSYHDRMNPASAFSDFVGYDWVGGIILRPTDTNAMASPHLGSTDSASG
jgi:hypothetical protein